MIFFIFLTCFKRMVCIVYIDLPTMMHVKVSASVTIKKTTCTLIFDFYDEPVTPSECNMIVERLGDYIID
jgi:hypothetical protein